MDKQTETQPKLSRSLKSRHITMIAIGGAIGTGLFLGSGSAIRAAGPAIILTYLIVGIFCFFMMRALGELLLADPSKHSFIDSVKEYLGDRMEFIAGWTYWSCWLSLAMADLTATGIYLKYWFPNLPQWVGPLVIVVLLMLVNMVNVGLFGELESWFSTIKVVAIIALIVVGLAMVLFHTKTHTGYASFANLVNHGGLFPTGAYGFLMSFQMVVFAFVGIEMVGLTAGETRDPNTDIPKAINTLPIRINDRHHGRLPVEQDHHDLESLRSGLHRDWGDVGGRHLKLRSFNRRHVSHQLRHLLHQPLPVRTSNRW